MPPTDGGADGGTDAQVVTDGGADASSDGGGTDGGLTDPRIPEMRPITRDEARALAAYARQLEVRSLGAVADEPMAWSLINLQCSDRALAINWALAAADPARLDEPPPPLRADDITDDSIAALHDAPAFDSARIFVNAPLVTTQRILDPSGTEVALEPAYWPYHVGTVVNVEGTIEVIDLSVGDEPMSVDAWLASFVSPEATCELRDEVDALNQWVYWMQASGGAPGYDPADAPPTPECVYYYVPLFQHRWDLPPIGAIEARSLAESLVAQTVVFRAMLADFGGGYTDADIPHFLSEYEAHTLGWMCDEFGTEGGYPVCERF
jgi:hypothetical protein